MLGGMDDLVIIKDEQNTLSMGFGIEEGRQMFDLSDHVGVNFAEVDGALHMADISWEHVIRRVWPLHDPLYATDSMSADEYKVPAIASGLPDTRAAFAQAQEFGTWTMDLLWTEVMNRIDRVNAYTERDKKKKRTRPNPVGYRAAPQEMFMRLYKQLLRERCHHCSISEKHVLGEKDMDSKCHATTPSTNDVPFTKEDCPETCSTVPVSSERRNRLCSCSSFRKE
eukprot:4721556-Amphidinium_carterae.1